MGVHVELPSKALGVYLASVDDSTVYHLLVDAMDAKATFKRVDICSDNYGLHIDSVVAAMQDGYIVTRSWSITLMEKYVRRDSGRLVEKDGTTKYNGSHTTDRRVRFYDKAKEQGVEGVWTRAEVQLRDDLAHQTIIALLVDDTDLESVISSAVDFRLHDDTNTTRRLRLAWWEVWIGQFKRFHYKVSARVRLVGDAMEWVERQVAPTLAYLLRALSPDGFEQWLSVRVRQSEDKIPTYRLAHLAAMYRTQKAFA
jgi:phage replication initiation protein